MELSLLLGKVVAIYLIVIGISLLARQGMWMHVVKKFMKSSTLITVVAMAELILGLLIVISHNIWVQSWVVVVTLIGWIMVIEGAAYLLLPQDSMKGLIRSFNKPMWYRVCGIVSLALGLYLAYITFLG